jgi:hypothetical protein
LAPQVAVALATDILAVREFIIITLEISLLFDDPGSSFVNPLLDLC